MKKTTLLFILALSACASNKVLFMNEKGETVYKADCSAYRFDMSTCIQLAYEQCPLGFNVLMADNSIKGYWGATNTQGNINTNSYANIFGNANTTYGYNNSTTNIFANGYGNSSTNFNSNSFGGTSAQYSRYLIYTCKNPEQKKS